MVHTQSGLVGEARIREQKSEESYVVVMLYHNAADDILMMSVVGII